MNKIVAIVGMTGSGKSVVVDYFQKLNYEKVYFGGVTYDKLKEKNIEVTPLSEKEMREGLRKELGMGAYAIILLPKIEELYKKGNVVLDGLYSWSEYKILKEKFGDAFTLIAVVVDKNIRYQRLSERVDRPATYQDAQNRDIWEIEGVEKGGPIAFADYYVFNDKSKEDLEHRIDEILKKL